MIVGSTAVLVVCVLLCVSMVTGEAAGITQWHCVTTQQEKQPQTHHKGKGLLFFAFAYLFVTNFVTLSCSFQTMDSRGLLPAEVIHEALKVRGKRRSSSGFGQYTFSSDDDSWIICSSAYQQLQDKSVET